MPYFAPRRMQFSIPGKLKMGSLLPWIPLILLATSYSSIGSFQRWRDSRPTTKKVLRGATDSLGANQLKPRTWPTNYDDIPRTTSNAKGAPLRAQGDALLSAHNITMHKIRKFPPSCQPRSDWHSFSYPTGNFFHEIDIVSGIEEGNIHYGFSGATRESWLVETMQTTTILKTLRLREEYDEVMFEKQRIEAIVSERLTSSPHIIDIFGVTGTSSIGEYATEGNFAQTFRHQYSNGGNYTDRELLVFARDAALSLADLHDLDGRGNITSVVHHDLRAQNWLSSNGKLKLSDFNEARLLRWDYEKNRRCHGFDWSGGCGKTMESTNRKAPEECRRSIQRTRTTEKVEVYRSGSFLFYLLSGSDWSYSFEPIGPAGELGRPEPEKVKRLILSGKKPSLPPNVARTNSSDIQAIVHAMRMAQTYDTRKRPRARVIAEYLESQTAKGKNKDSDTVTVLYKGRGLRSG